MGIKWEDVVVEGRKGVPRVELFLRVEDRLHFSKVCLCLFFLIALFPRNDST